MTTTETCALKVCACTRPYPRQAQAMDTRRIDPNGTYCCKRCEEQATGSAFVRGCECGHPQCSAPMTKGIPPMQ
jgi:hypothetical protein